MLDDLRTQGIEPTIVFRSDQNEVIQGAVAADVATAFLPNLWPTSTIRVLGGSESSPRCNHG